VAVLADSLNLIKQGKVDLLVINAQTASPQVDQIVEAAKAAKVPVVEVTEFQTEPGQSFIAWMSNNILKIQTALAGGDPASVEGN
jgi:zinc/manganese transport system substrate-binding protein